jgi:hypothetical protein
MIPDSIPAGKTDVSISIAEANKAALLFAVPVTIGLIGLYLAEWGLGRLLHGLRTSPGLLIGWLVLVVIGVGVHEVIHGLAWAALGRQPLSSIQFGFDRKAFAPYCHCTLPMEVTAYRLGAVLPALLLGVLPYAVGLARGYAWLMAYGVIFITAAAGDLLVLWLLRRVPAGKLVADHPTRAGCYVLDTPSHTTRREAE